MNGTQLSDGTVLAGDDAQDFRDAGYTVEPVTVFCSKQIVQGEQAIPAGRVRVAVDANNAFDRVNYIVQGYGKTEPALGFYKGRASLSIVAMIDPVDIYRLHELLLEIEGFGCFAVLADLELNPTCTPPLNEPEEYTVHMTRLYSVTAASPEEALALYNDDPSAYSSHDYDVTVTDSMGENVTP